MYKLLICEDEPLERKVLHMIIQRRYSNIRFVGDAATGIEAVKLARQHMPDIILMDISMPQCNGLDAQHEIINFLPDVKTIIITAYNDFSYAQQAVKYKVADFLLKPVAPNDLYASLNQVISELSESTPSSSSSAECTDSIQMILDYIDQHFLEDLTVKDIASMFGFSEKYFSRYFKQKTKVSFTDYITNLKIERSKNMLLYSDAPIYEIAMDLNFSDSSYFSKVFKRKEGMLPSQYRKSRKF